MDEQHQDEWYLVKMSGKPIPLKKLEDMAKQHEGQPGGQHADPYDRGGWQAPGQGQDGQQQAYGQPGQPGHQPGQPQQPGQPPRPGQQPAGQHRPGQPQVR